MVPLVKDDFHGKTDIWEELVTQLGYRGQILSGLKIKNSAPTHKKAENYIYETKNSGLLSAGPFPSMNLRGTVPLDIWKMKHILLCKAEA